MVHMKPRFDKPPSVIIQPGGSVLLECLCTAKPEPTVAWFYKNQQITRDENPRCQMTVRKTAGKFVVSLQILDATQKDQGVYKAVARNEAGEHSTEQHFVAKLSLNNSANEIYNTNLIKANQH